LKYLKLIWERSDNPTNDHYAWEDVESMVLNKWDTTKEAIRADPNYWYDLDKAHWFWYWLEHADESTPLSEQERIKQCVEGLDDLGVPITFGRDRARRQLHESGHHVENKILSLAIKERKAHAFEEDGPDASGVTPLQACPYGGTPSASAALDQKLDDEACSNF
jgi:hypothetical protein